ncbi:MAG: septum formation initiator family protein [Desulfobulbaceae bacterium]|jgi:cell division protein FtsB|nr:septum formation initiator family protein [Desulfobulbaceae bacterium]MDY0351578.1 septum formation initiator family protein [Desulfobulbaceae bacterium]
MRQALTRQISGRVDNMVQRHQKGLTLAERRFLRRLIFIVAVLGLLWIVFAPERGLLHYHRLHKQIETLSRENRELAERNAQLKKEIERLRSDESYLEELARKKYGLLKENETVYEFKSKTPKK